MKHRIKSQPNVFILGVSKEQHTMLPSDQFFSPNTAENFQVVPPALQLKASNVDRPRANNIKKASRSDSSPQSSLSRHVQPFELTLTAKQHNHHKQVAGHASKPANPTIDLLPPAFTHRLPRKNKSVNHHKKQHHADLTKTKLHRPIQQPNKTIDLLPPAFTHRQQKTAKKNLSPNKKHTHAASTVSKLHLHWAIPPKKTIELLPPASTSLGIRIED